MFRVGGEPGKEMKKGVQARRSMTGLLCERRKSIRTLEKDEDQLYRRFRRSDTHKKTRSEDGGGRI